MSAGVFGEITPNFSDIMLPPFFFTLKDDTPATVLHFTKSYPKPSPPDGFFKCLLQIFNDEIETGLTYPFNSPLTFQQFLDYFVAADAFVAVRGHHSDWKILLKTQQWEEYILGMYYIKPNYPGRSSHICNAGFMVAKNLRNQGVATGLGKSYIKYGPALGYVGSIFNLVYSTNIASASVWDKLGFERVGRIPKAGRLKGQDDYIDAIVFWYDFTTIPKMT